MVSTNYRNHSRRKDEMEVMRLKQDLTLKLPRLPLYKMRMIFSSSTQKLLECQSTDEMERK